MGCVTDRMGDGSYLTGKAELVEEFPTWAKIYIHGIRLKYRGPIIRVTSPASGSNDLSLDQSGMSIQILLEPNAVT